MLKMYCVILVSRFIQHYIQIYTTLYNQFLFDNFWMIQQIVQLSINGWCVAFNWTQKSAGLGKGVKPHIMWVLQQSDTCKHLCFLYYVVNNNSMRLRHVLVKALLTSRIVENAKCYLAVSTLYLHLFLTRLVFANLNILI